MIGDIRKQTYIEVISAKLEGAYACANIPLECDIFGSTIQRKKSFYFIVQKIQYKN